MSGHCTQPSKPGAGEEECLKINLGWREGLSQRFHRLSQTALDKLITLLRAVKYQRGRQAPLDVGIGEIQRLCSAARCVLCWLAAMVRFLLDFANLELQCRCPRANNTLVEMHAAVDEPGTSAVCEVAHLSMYRLPRRPRQNWPVAGRGLRCKQSSCTDGLTSAVVADELSGQWPIKRSTGIPEKRKLGPLRQERARHPFNDV